MVVDDPVGGGGQNACWSEGIVLLRWSSGGVTGWGWVVVSGGCGRAADRIDGEAGGAAELVGDGGEG